MLAVPSVSVFGFITPHSKLKRELIRDFSCLEITSRSEVRSPLVNFVMLLYE